MKNKRSKKNNKTLKICVFAGLMVIALIVLILLIEGNANKLNKDRISANGTYQIRFSDLVSLESLQEYNNKTVTAVGYMSPIMSYDGSFGYLMNLPYQTCPYCVPNSDKITNTIAIYAKNGEKLEFTEAAVTITGTLKLENYTDSYGYSYNYRIVDATVDIADTSNESEKIVLYNQLAEKQILTGILNTIYSVDSNVFYDQYVANGQPNQPEVVEVETLNQVIKDLESFDQNDVKILVNISLRLKEVVNETNSLIQNGNLDKLSEYKRILYTLFNAVNTWMAEYEL